jgi:hypothetical protein
MTFKRFCLLYAAGLCILLLACLSLIHPCVGEEVELTNEWQLLGENDTVPAGAHIRMDLTNGGRWAKLSTEEDDEEETEVAIDASGGIVSVKKDEKSSTVTDKKEQGFDYDMMHRALSHLPIEERERMGGLPELPEEDADPMVRKAFEVRMKEIWTKRQAELQKIQEEAMADLPKLLLERVKRIDAYLQDPTLELSQEWKDEKEEGMVTHIQSVVEDLENLFSDIDVTRDFHYLGGWPLLVSLLSDKVHVSPNTTLTPEQLEKVQDIQSHAAWAVGTAVKNIGEFAPWATEQLSIDGVKTTPIELLLDQLKRNDNVKKSQKMMYALGSLLRSNRVAQARFCADGGPAVLGSMLSDAAQDPASADTKLTKRILALADDVVSDVTLHPYEQDDAIDKLIIASFSKDEYCQSPIRLLDQEALQENALQTIEALEPYCQWDKELVRSSVAKVKEERQDQDDDHIVELADSILSSL